MRPSRFCESLALDLALQVTVPQHRMTPLKTSWLSLYKPVTENMQLDMRMNLKTKKVCVSVHACVGVRVYVRACLCVSACVCACVRACLRVCARLHCTHMRMHECVHVGMSVCVWGDGHHGVDHACLDIACSVCGGLFASAHSLVCHGHTCLFQAKQPLVIGRSKCLCHVFSSCLWLLIFASS